MAGLTLKQEAFCMAYIETGNASEAYRRSYDAEGMKPETINRRAFDMFENSKIKARVTELKEGHQKRHEVTVDYVLSVIQSTVERCRQVEQVLDRKGDPVFVQNGDGEYVPAYTFDAANVLKGTDQLGRYLKMFTDKTELSNPDGSLRPAAPIYNVIKK